MRERRLQIIAPWYQMAPLMVIRSSGETIAFHSRLSPPFHEGAGPPAELCAAASPSLGMGRGGMAQGLPLLPPPALAAAVADSAVRRASGAYAKKSSCIGYCRAAEGGVAPQAARAAGLLHCSTRVPPTEVRTMPMGTPSDWWKCLWVVRSACVRVEAAAQCREQTRAPETPVSGGKRSLPLTWRSTMRLQKNRLRSRDR